MGIHVHGLAAAVSRVRVCIGLVPQARFRQREFTERLGNRLGAMTPTGRFSSLQVAGGDGGPEHTTLGDDGTLWFTESATNGITRVTPERNPTSSPWAEPAHRHPAEGRSLLASEVTPLCQKPSPSPSPCVEHLTQDPGQVHLVPII